MARRQMVTVESDVQSSPEDGPADTQVVAGRQGTRRSARGQDRVAASPEPNDDGAAEAEVDLAEENVAGDTEASDDADVIIVGERVKRVWYQSSF